MHRYARWKFTILLTVMLLMLGTRMIVGGKAEGDLLLDLLGAALIIVAIIALAEERKFRVAALVLGIPAAVLTLAAHLFAEEIARGVAVLARANAALFLAFTVGVIVRATLTERRVTWDTIVGAFCGYLLIGVIWTELYCAVEVAEPGSFAVPAVNADSLKHRVRRREVLEYFSFVTLTTIGYGDITPLTPAARGLACFEAVCGQLYLAVLVAGLVGIRTTGRTPDV